MKVAKCVLEQGGIEMNFCLSVSVISVICSASVHEKAPASVGMLRLVEFLGKLANREAEG